jgi:hypothetical protein
VAKGNRDKACFYSEEGSIKLNNNNNNNNKPSFGQFQNRYVIIFSFKMII